MKLLKIVLQLASINFLLIPQNLSAQSKSEADASCFEFSVTANYLPYRITKSAWEQGYVNYNDSLRAVSIAGDVDCGIGILKNFQLMNGALIRTGIQMQFFNNTVKYDLLTENHNLAFKTVSANVPLSFIYLFNDKGKKKEYVKPYILAGGRYSANFIKSTEASEIFTYQPHDVMADVGVGMHLYGKRKHLLAIELIYSKGFLNMKNSSTVKTDVYNGTIKNIYRQAFLFSINLS